MDGVRITFSNMLYISKPFCCEKNDRDVLRIANEMVRNDRDQDIDFLVYKLSRKAAEAGTDTGNSFLREPTWNDNMIRDGDPGWTFHTDSRRWTSTSFLGSRSMDDVDHLAREGF